MELNLLIAFILPLSVARPSCDNIASDSLIFPASISSTNPYKTIGSIPLPPGFTRVAADSGSFGQWLRSIELKSDKTVYLYNGSRKENQSAQFAVLNISVGNKDLQQCADAVMRLRAEYLYQKDPRQIDFADNNGKHYRCPVDANRKEFLDYLEKVFSYCGTLSLEKQLRRTHDIHSIQPGDVFIKGGSPGHAVIVVDVATNASGKRIFMLAQSYMPAQDIHILVNPQSPSIAWYQAVDGRLDTPEWIFYSNQLKTW